MQGGGTIDVRLIFSDNEAQVEINRFKQQLTELDALKNRINSSAFNAFSRSQIQPQIQALDELSSRVRKVIAELSVQATTIQGPNLSNFINSLVGADRVIQAASTSARVLRNSIGDLAFNDSVRRDADAIAAAASRTAQAVRASSSTGTSNADIVAQMRALDSVYSRRPPGGSAPPPLPNFDQHIQQFQKINAELESTSQRYVSLRNSIEQLSKVKGFNLENIAAFKQQLDSLRGQISALVQSGAQGSTESVASALEDIANFEKQGVYAKLVEDAGKFVAAQRSVAEAVKRSNAEQTSAVQGRRVLQGALREGTGESTADIIARNATNLTRPVRDAADAAKTFEAAWASAGRNTTGVWRTLITLFDEFSRGQRGAMMSTFGSMLRRGSFGSGGPPQGPDSDLIFPGGRGGVGSSSSGGGLGGFGVGAGLGAIVAASAIERIIAAYARWNTEAAKLAETHRILASAIGVSVGKFNELNAATELAGGGTKTLSSALELIGNQMTAAVRDPSSEIATELQRVGLNWDDLRAKLGQPGSSIEVLRQLADLWQRMGATPQREATFSRILGGRSAMVELAPLLEGGASGIDKLIQRAHELGSAVDQGLNDKLVEAHHKILELDSAWEGFKNSVVGGNIFGKVIEDLTTILQMLSGHGQFVQPNQLMSLAGDTLKTNLSLMFPALAPIMAMTRRGAEAKKSSTLPDQVDQTEAKAYDRNRGPDFTYSAQAARQYYEELLRVREAEARTPEERLPIAQERERFAKLSITQQEQELQKSYGSLPEAQAKRNTQQLQAQANVFQQEDELNRQRVESAIRAQEAIAADEHRGTEERIAALEKVKEIMGDAQYVARPEIGLPARPMYLQPAMEEEQRRINTAKRQFEDATFRAAVDEARARISLEHTTVNQIIAEYDRLFAKARETGQNPQAIAELQREKTRDILRAQTDSFNQAREAESAQEKLDSTRLGLAKAQLQNEVNAHRMSKAQMAQQEAQLTSQVMAQEEARVSAALQDDNLQDDQKAKLYQHLSELYAKDAELQAQYQAKITQDIEAENEKRLKDFKDLFDNIGSDFENYLTKVLGGSGGRNAFADAIKGLREHLTGGILKFAGDELSRFAGGKLAKFAGVDISEDKDKSLGGVLSKIVGKWLGLEKDVPKDTGQQTVNLLQKSVSAEEKQVEILNRIADNLKAGGVAVENQKAALGMSSKTQSSGPIDLTEGLRSSGGGKFSVASGANITEGNEPIIADILAHAAAKLPEGYRVNLTTGFARSGHAPNSAHYEGNAADVHIYGPQGEIPNRGPDTTGMYGLLNKHFKEYQEANYPELTKYHRFGESLETKKGSGQADLMHQDFKGAPLDTAGLQRLAAGTDKVAQSNDKLIQATAVQAKEIQASASNDNKLNSSVATNDQKTDENTKAVDRLTDKIGSVGTSGTQIASAKQGDTSAATDPNANSGAGSSLKSATSNLSTGIADITGVLGSIGALAGLLGGKNSPIARDIGIAGSVISVFSGLFKLGGFFGLFEQGGIVPSAAGGMIVGGASGGTLSLLHPREMVLPAGISQGLQGMIGQNRPANDNSLSNNSASSSDVYHIHVHAPDGPAAHRFLMNNSDSIVAAMQKSRRNFR